MNKKVIIFLILGIFLSLGIVFISTNYNFKRPQTVYRVYLKGKSMGLIQSKEKLEEYIDKEQSNLKQKYKEKKEYKKEKKKIEKKKNKKKNI